MITETVLNYPDIVALMKEAGFVPATISAQQEGRLGVLARAIEQAVLQSPEIQALRKDKERYQRALERISIWGRPWTQDDLYGRNWRGCAAEALYGGFDAAMEQQT